MNIPKRLTGIKFLFSTFVLQWLVEKMQIHFNGTFGCFEIKRMPSKNIFQPQEPYVGPQRHFPHAVGVEIELILDDFRKMLQRQIYDLN